MQPTFTFHHWILLTLSVLSISQQVSGQSKPGDRQLPHGIPQGWYSQAVAKIEEREYFIRPLESPHVYGAVNHAQHLGYWFTGNGYEVGNFNEDGSTANIWHTQFLLAGVGRKEKLHKSSLSGSSCGGEHSLQFNYGDYVITYDNEKPGMEQSFLLNKKPAGAGPMEIVMGLKGDLEARIGAAGELLLCKIGHPQDVKLVYDQLKVWDKNNRMLPAHMTLTNNRRLVLTVDDRRAVYPVTVDPFAHGPSQAFTAENILQSGIIDANDHVLFGFSVSGAGDVTGDGLGDIIIGAPTFTVITSINNSGGGKIVINRAVASVGAAFIYKGILGSAPSTVPTKVFQPSGLATGALFGYSVSTVGNAGGNATNKGVVIGAPGDQRSLNFSSGTTTVAIGRAYVYTSLSNFTGSVAAATNPDAVLSLKASDFSSGAAPPNRNPMFGFSVSDAGDVNGDGFDDIIVGSPIYNNISAVGRADIYPGSAAGVSLNPATSIIGSIAGAYFGFSVSSAGNVNGDQNSTTHIGLDDVIIGAPGGIIAGGIIQGTAYIFHGNAAGITANNSNAATGTIGTTLHSTTGVGATGTLFGFSVSTAGDVDHDGHGDVIIGEPLALHNGGAGGNAYVFYGSGNSAGIGSPSNPMSTLSSPRAAVGANLLFGFSVGTAGNVVGDAASDVLVGEPGSVAASSSVHTLLSVLGLTSNTTVTTGQAYVFAGVSGSGIGAGASPLQTVSDPSTTPNLLGTSVHAAGDIDGDGSPDFIVGEPSGILDLSFNLTLLLAIPGVTLQGTLTTGSNKGLITIGTGGQAILFFGSTGTLPLTLLDFTGQAEKGDVLLNWVTGQEENSDYFQVERSTDNLNFSAIGKVTAAHNSTQTSNYSFVDGAPVVGNNYYRLKIVDLDGQFVYSKVVVVNFSGSSTSGISVYPNPAHGSFRLLFKNMKAGRYEMNLLNPIGQTVQIKVIQVADPANYNETVDLDPSLARGAYLVRVVDQQQRTYITRIMVQ